MYASMLYQLRREARAEQLAEAGIRLAPENGLALGGNSEFYTKLGADGAGIQRSRCCTDASQSYGHNGDRYSKLAGGVSRTPRGAAGSDGGGGCRPCSWAMMGAAAPSLVFIRDCR